MNSNDYNEQIDMVDEQLANEQMFINNEFKRSRNQNDDDFLDGGGENINHTYNETAESDIDDIEGLNVILTFIASQRQNDYLNTKVENFNDQNNHNHENQEDNQENVNPNSRYVLMTNIKKSFHMVIICVS